MSRGPGNTGGHGKTDHHHHKCPDCGEHICCDETGEATWGDLGLAILTMGFSSLLTSDRHNRDHNGNCK